MGLRRWCYPINNNIAIRSAHFGRECRNYEILVRLYTVGFFGFTSSNILELIYVMPKLAVAFFQLVVVVELVVVAYSDCCVDVDSGDCVADSGSYATASSFVGTYVVSTNEMLLLIPV
ncbi:hypothetical protein ACH5RR_023987 [Cinchona calisaya]|uniref:Uncharacterized protein n=1 Tax=Cinchona calisaya TaxID=153742 RepID=A0ABD2ZC78_9GENT